MLKVQTLEMDTSQIGPGSDIVARRPQLGHLTEAITPGALARTGVLPRFTPAAHGQFTRGPLRAQSAPVETIYYMVPLYLTLWALVHHR